MKAHQTLPGFREPVYDPERAERDQDAEGTVERGGCLGFVALLCGLDERRACAWAYACCLVGIVAVLWFKSHLPEPPCRIVATYLGEGCAATGGRQGRRQTVSQIRPIADGDLTIVLRHACHGTARCGKCNAPMVPVYAHPRRKKCLCASCWQDVPDVEEKKTRG